jgi:hypothetical protein
LFQCRSSFAFPLEVPKFIVGLGQETFCQGPPLPNAGRPRQAVSDPLQAFDSIGDICWRSTNRARTMGSFATFASPLVLQGRRYQRAPAQ